MQTQGFASRHRNGNTSRTYKAIRIEIETGEHQVVMDGIEAFTATDAQRFAAAACKCRIDYVTAF